MSKILKHPDKEKIIEMLNAGDSVRDVEKWLQEKYPDQKNMHITFVTLQNFRKKNLNLEGKVLRDIQDATIAERQKADQLLQQKQLEQTNAYQEKINSIAQEHLDVQKQIMTLNTVVEQRIEYWYNLIASGDELPGRADGELRKYIDQQVNILQQYKRLVEGMADKTVDYNINVSVLNDQISVIRDVIKETIADLGTEKAMLFMDRLNKKLGQTNYRPPNLRSEPVDLKQLQAMDAELIDE